MSRVPGLSVGAPPSTPDRHDRRNEDQFRRQVFQTLKQLASLLESIQDRIDQSFAAGVLDRVETGHFKISADTRTEDATLKEAESGHFEIQPDVLTGVRFVLAGEFNHYRIEV